MKKIFLFIVFISSVIACSPRALRTENLTNGIQPGAKSDPLKPEPIEPDPSGSDDSKQDPIKPEPIKPDPIDPGPIKPAVGFSYDVSQIPKDLTTRAVLNPVLPSGISNNFSNFRFRSEQNTDDASMDDIDKLDKTSLDYEKNIQEIAEKVYKSKPWILSYNDGITIDNKNGAISFSPRSKIDENIYIAADYKDENNQVKTYTFLMSMHIVYPIACPAVGQLSNLNSGFWDQMSFPSLSLINRFSSAKKPKISKTDDLSTGAADLNCFYSDASDQTILNIVSPSIKISAANGSTWINDDANEDFVCSSIAPENCSFTIIE